MKATWICALLLTVSLALAEDTLDGSSGPPEAISGAVAKALAKSTVAQLPATCLALLRDLTPNERLTYASSMFALVGSNTPAALTAVASSVTRAYPSLAPGIALAAAKSNPVQLPDIVGVVVAAAPNQMVKTLTAVAQNYPDNQQAIVNAATKVFPDSARIIKSAVAVAVGAEEIRRKSKNYAKP